MKEVNNYINLCGETDENQKPGHLQPRPAASQRPKAPSHHTRDQYARGHPQIIISVRQPTAHSAALHHLVQRADRRLHHAAHKRLRGRQNFIGARRQEAQQNQKLCGGAGGKAIMNFSACIWTGTKSRASRIRSTSRGSKRRLPKLKSCSKKLAQG